MEEPFRKKKKPDPFFLTQEAGAVVSTGDNRRGFYLTGSLRSPALEDHPDSLPYK